MTVIAGFVQDGVTWVGGDSAGTGSDLFQVIRRDAKVFQTGPMLVGFTFSWRMGQLLRHRVRPPVRPSNIDPHEWLVTVYVEELRRAFHAGGFTWHDHQREMGGPFLLGYAGSLYEIGSEFDVADYGAGPAAVGCGRDFALGSLFSTPGMEPRSRLKLALRAAERYSAGVAGPFVVRCLKE